MEDARRKSDTDRRTDEEESDAAKITRSAVEGEQPMRKRSSAPEEEVTNDNRPNRVNDEPEPDEEGADMDMGDIPTEIDDKADRAIDRGADPDVRKKER